MNKYFKLVMSWVCIILAVTGMIPGNLFVNTAAAASGELIWPNAGAINLTKASEPVKDAQGKWNVTLTVEGKNIKSTSDVVLLVDQSSSMSDNGRMTSAKAAAKKFVDNLLFKDSTTRIALVSFGTKSTQLSTFKGYDQKSALLTSVDNISAGDYKNNIQYTNIQDGLHAASTLLDNSQADNKVIVLLSDGAPTRSYKAASAADYAWPTNNYSHTFILSSFNYSSVVGSAANFGITSYNIKVGKKTYTVKDNGIATLSEAKLIQNKGYGIYSIGLEVGSDANAQYVLSNVQNKGYYSSSSSDLSKVFTDLSGKISYAAQNAKVVDPMGDMFNKISDVTVSQGTITWNSAKETITWDIGSVMEGAPATMTYTVQMDDSKNPDPNKLYPTNGTTTISYTDVNGTSTSKNFEVPTVSFGKGSIKVKGYHVNADGKPVNADGVVVDRPDLAEQLYSDNFSQNGQESLDVNQSYSVTAKALDGYQLKTGVSPTTVSLTTSDPSPIVWFGYTNAPNSLKVEYKAGDTVLEQAQELQKIQGEAVDLTAKAFDGYQLKEVKLSSDSGLTTADGGHVTGVMPGKDVTVTFSYEPTAQHVTVKYLERGTDKSLAAAQTIDGVTNEELTLKAAEVAGYTAEEASHKYTLTAGGIQEYVFYYTANAQTVTVKFLEQGTDKELADSKTVEGTTGSSAALTAVLVPGYTAVETKHDYTYTADGKQEYVFYYTANKQTVTVKYLEQGTNKVLAEAKTVEGATGKATDLTAAPIAGYTPLEETHSYSFTTGSAQEYVFYYTPNEQTVTVKYVDDETKEELIAAAAVKGKTGETVTLTPEAIAGYTPTKSQDTYEIAANGSNEYVFYYTANGQSVTVKFVDKDTKEELAPSVTVDGKTGRAVEVQAATVPGYTPEMASDTYTIAASAPNEYVFYYTPNDQTVTVKYLEQGTDKLLFSPTTLTAKTGQNVDVTAAPLAGYTPVETTGTLKVTAEGPNVYVFYYTPNDQKVTVKYVDQDTNKELFTPTELTGKTGQTADLKAADLPGYTPVKADGTFEFVPGGPSEYVFYYTANAQTVTVKYLEQGTDKELAKASAEAGKTGDTIELTAAQVPGYTAKEASFLYKIEGGGPQVYAFYYTADTQTVTVKYVDQGTGQELDASAAGTGIIGQTLELKAAEVAGYTPAESTHTYTFTAGADQEFTFFYTANPQKVTVKYLEKDTMQVLEQPAVIEGVTGKEVTLEAAAVAGYSAAEASHTYKFSAEASQDYVFFYTADKQTVTVKYLEKGTEKVLLPSTTAEGIIHQNVQLTAEEVPGYTPEEAEAAYTFTAAGEQVYIFYYSPVVLSLNVKYVDKETGTEISESGTIQGSVGQEAVLEAVNVAGYTADEAVHSYIFTADNTQEYVFEYSANKQSVTVKYLDKTTGQPLAEEKQVDGATDREVMLEALGLEGYTPEQAAYNYVFTAEAAQEHVFYYTADEQTVSVTYIERATGKELSEPASFSGVIGEKVDLEAPALAGYTPEEPTHSYTFTAESSQAYTFYYTAADHNVTVKYLQRGTGTVLASEFVATGKTGETIKLTAAEVAGFTPEDAEASYTITTDAEQEYVFYYTTKEQTVTVKYLNRSTNVPVADESTVSGQTGETVELTAAEVSGYTPVEYTASYQLTAETSQVYVFYYTQDQTEPEPEPQPEQRDVTVNYVYTDPASESEIPLMEPSVQSGNVGDVLHLTAEPLTVADAVYTPTVFNFDYTITDGEEQQYTFYYEPDSSEDVYQLFITYLDRETGDELGSDTRQGKENDTIEIKPDPITVADAVYNPEQSLYSYTFTGDPDQELEIYYNKEQSDPTDPEDPPAAEDQQVTVRYLKQGTETALSSPTVETGKAGDTITLTAPAVSGYTAVNSSYDYTFTDGDGQEYIFYYKKNSTSVVTTPTTSSSDSSSDVSALPPAPPVTALPPAPVLDKDNHYNYVFGYPDGTIKPLNNISREEVAEIFYRLMDDATRSDYMVEDSSFSDVSDTRWSNQAIATMQNAGIITGYQDGTFKPGQAITRAEFAAIASRFDELDGQENTMFSDVQGHWAEKYIVSAANKGWIKGYPDGTFRPDQYITRAEAMAFINSVLDRKVTEEGISADAKMWPDNTSDKWYYLDVIEATNNHDYDRNDDGETETWTEVKPDHIYP
ncbi:MucBP domain-containing protein [Paenibacillus pinistramenti]|uniref:MucBP domain-containing protein n=1 Tax=Paenibacillus pinistramenti TaxID=1768003 RepID=UPI0011093112|nr:MucBP domain-containing protein [Paenibacillus pinistramenti]